MNELMGLAIAMAEHKHKVWASERIKQGWTYGPIRDDALKTHPYLIPYQELPEMEKEINLMESIDTIKFIQNLGFEISKSKK